MEASGIHARCLASPQLRMCLVITAVPWRVLSRTLAIVVVARSPGAWGETLELSTMIGCFRAMASFPSPRPADGGLLVTACFRCAGAHARLVMAGAPASGLIICERTFGRNDWQGCPAASELDQGGRASEPRFLRFAGPRALLGAGQLSVRTCFGGGRGRARGRAEERTSASHAQSWVVPFNSCQR